MHHTKFAKRVCLLCTRTVERVGILYGHEDQEDGTMKRIVLASASVLALAAAIGSAQAADLPRQMVTKAPAYVAPYYNWTGFYLGINGGGAWGSSSWDSIGSFDGTGGMTGGPPGYNWQCGQWVPRSGADLPWAHAKSHSTHAI